MIMESLGGRKFILTVMVIFMGFILAITNKIDYNQFSVMITVALGIFSTTNALQKVGKLSEPEKKESPPA